jgi:hypothetical protein
VLDLTVEQQIALSAPPQGDVREASERGVGGDREAGLKFREHVHDP